MLSFAESKIKVVCVLCCGHSVSFPVTKASLVSMIYSTVANFSK